MPPNCNLRTLTQATDSDLQDPFVAAHKRQNSYKDTEANAQNSSYKEVMATWKTCKPTEKAVPPALCIAPHLVLARASPQLLGDPHWEPTHIRSAKKMVCFSPSSFPDPSHHMAPQTLVPAEGKGKKQEQKEQLEPDNWTGSQGNRV